MIKRNRKKGQKRKNTRKKKRKIRVVSRWRLVGFIAAAFFMLTVTFSVFYIGLGHYDGLGLRYPAAENPYDLRFLQSHKGRLFYEDEKYISLTGIDVSYYQQEIDWEKVKADGVDFAMIRVGYRGSTEGRISKDEWFRKNVRRARKAGIETGVYFFSQAVTVEEAVEEARYVVRHIKGKGITYPVVFDMEPIPGAGRIDHLTKMEKTRITDAFCQVIERNGYVPMVYGNPQWMSSHIELGYLTDYPVWLAHYTGKTDFPYNYSIWQYTDKGKVDGIKGKVDMNIQFVLKDKKEKKS